MYSPVLAQQRWFENGPNIGSYKRVQWENIAAVIFYNPENPNSAVGARIYTISNGRFEEWGAVPKESTSLPKLRQLIEANQQRWIKMQPHENGAYLRPNQAVGFADINRIVTLIKVYPIEFGQEVYQLTLENFNGRAAIVDENAKARVEKMIADSVIP